MKKVIIIAEAGVNHNGDFLTACKLVDAAAEAGADYVKFQTFKADKLVSKDAVKANYQISNMNDADSSQFNMLKALELSDQMHVDLKAYAASRSIQFLSTGFDEDSIDYLQQLGIDLFKVPSGEITNLPYLVHIAGKNKPVILSTGMATLQEVGDAIQVLITNGVKKEQISVLHCNTEYPTPMSDVNLLAMHTLAETFNVEVGYSDHTLGTEVTIAAVALGATIIEKHFTLDRNMKGPDHKASLEPAELKFMVQCIRNIELALGKDVKEPSPSEAKNIKIARKSIHTSRELKKDEAIAAADLIMLRPGDGISPMHIAQVLEKRATKDLPAGYKLTPGDIY